MLTGGNKEKEIYSMKKKLIIYLLAAVMVLSPAAVFADAADTAGTDAGELDIVQSEAMLFNGNSSCEWVDANRTQAKDAKGNIAVGLFKAPRIGGGTSLYYADASGIVVKRETLITVSTGEKYVHINTTEGEHWDVTGGGALSYAITNHDGDYFVHWQQGIITINGVKYYVLPNGTVQTTPGLITVSGKLYYVTEGGPVRSQAGFFKANNGKTYLSDATGAIITTAGIRQYGGSYYVIQSDGSVGTTVGFVRAGGKLCYVTNSSGVLAVNKEFKVSGKKYHALNDASIAIGGHKWGKKYYYADDSGAIRTKKGIMKAGGKYFFVQKGGAVATNKKVKWKGKSYIASKNGAIYTGLFTWKKNMYYANSKGVLRKKAGVITYDAYKYYVQKGGKVKKNTLFTAKGKKYCAGKDGKLLEGYFNWKGGYYLTNAKSVIITKQGLYSYRNNYYFVGKGGKLAAEKFVEWKDKFYYANSKGVIVRSKFTYRRNGTKYTLHPSSKTGEISSDEYYKVFPEKAPKPANTDTQDASSAQ